MEGGLIAMSFARYAGAVAAAAVLAMGSAVAVSAHGMHRSQPAYTVKLGQAVVKGHKERVLTAADGHTLYYLTGSTAAKVECTAACAKIWPPLLLPKGKPVVPKGLKGVTVAKTADGRMVLFRGHPLFRFVKDARPGEALGQGLKKVWFAATPSLRAPKSSSGGGW